jgi:hypothetical protein
LLSVFKGNTPVSQFGLGQMRAGKLAKAGGDQRSKHRGKKYPSDPRKDASPGLRRSRVRARAIQHSREISMPNVLPAVDDPVPDRG